MPAPAPILQPESPPPPTAERGDARLPELDALRGLAALGVVLYHYTQRYDELYHHAAGLWARFPWGRYGVQFFFIISGFVIHLTLHRSRGAGDFALKRTARLFPAFWLCCGVTYVLVRTIGLPGRGVSPGVAALNFTIAPLWFRWVIDGVWYVDGSYWSLKEEGVFYIVMAVALLLRRRGIAIYLVMACTALHLFGADSSPWLAAHLGFTKPADLYPSFSLRWFSLFLVGMAMFEARAGFRSRHALALALAAADIAPRALWLRTGDAEGWEFFMLGLGMVFTIFAATWWQPAVLRWKPLLFLGAISYPLYLLHQNIGYMVMRALEGRGVNPNAAVGAALLLVIGMATLVTFFVERPVYLWIRRKVEKPRVRIVAAAVQA